jgi:DNA-binding IclR family transcriptional regulator
MEEPTKDTIIKQQELIIRDQQTTIDTLHNELAHHREREHLIDDSRWGFALWLILNDVWPFSLWYHRFDGGQQ